ncbi:MAG: hypothetical protein LUO93_12205 [Methanomicrobiales archaeon]|nr:hypothetical protein [Methanomicrobiales archaeon]
MFDLYVVGNNDKSNDVRVEEGYAVCVTGSQFNVRVQSLSSDKDCTLVSFDYRHVTYTPQSKEWPVVGKWDTCVRVKLWVTPKETRVMEKHTVIFVLVAKKNKKQKRK